MYENLMALGLRKLDHIKKYRLHTEANRDVLKIYFDATPGHFFGHSETFVYPRQLKRIKVDTGPTNEYISVSEISPTLRYVVDELDQIARH